MSLRPNRGAGQSGSSSQDQSSSTQRGGSRVFPSPTAEEFSAYVQGNNLPPIAAGQRSLAGGGSRPQSQEGGAFGFPAPSYNSRESAGTTREIPQSAFSDSSGSRVSSSASSQPRQGHSFAWHDAQQPRYSQPSAIDPRIDPRNLEAYRGQIRNMSPGPGGFERAQRQAQQIFQQNQAAASRQPAQSSNTRPGASGPSAQARVPDTEYTRAYREISRRAESDGVNLGHAEISRRAQAFVAQRRRAAGN